MKHTQEEITNALQVIQDTCLEAQSPHPCDACPLSINGECVLQEQSPDEWKIRPTLSIWKAFE